MINNNNMTKKRISFKDVSPNYILSTGRGWEIRLENGNIPTGGLSRRGMSMEEKESVRSYIKGLRRMFNRAKESHAFDDVMGNYKSVNDKYKAILKGMSQSDIREVGRGASPILTFYIDGSVGSYIKKTNT